VFDQLFQKYFVKVIDNMPFGNRVRIEKNEIEYLNKDIELFINLKDGKFKFYFPKIKNVGISKKSILYLKTPLKNNINIFNSSSFFRYNWKPVYLSYNLGLKNLNFIKITLSNNHLPNDIFYKIYYTCDVKRSSFERVEKNISFNKIESNNTKMNISLILVNHNYFSMYFKTLILINLDKSNSDLFNINRIFGLQGLKYFECKEKLQTSLLKINSNTFIRSSNKKDMIFLDAYKNNIFFGQTNIGLVSIQIVRGFSDLYIKHNNSKAMSLGIGNLLQNVKLRSNETFTGEINVSLY
jgi:hypothetical protein